MFKLAIKNATNYLRPIITGKLKYNSLNIENSIATLIVLNENGDILTTATNADLFIHAEEIKEVYPQILKEINNSSKKQIKKIEEKYGITNETIVALHNVIIDALKIDGKFNIIKHPYLDLAIIKCENASEIYVKEFPTFNTTYEVGTSICNIGFAFPEYDTFIFDKENLCIKSHNKIMNFPIFPINGIITRNIADKNNEITMFETSISLFDGQNGGTVVNDKGEVLGMLVANKKLYINKTDSISLAYAINSKTIIEFLNNNGIKINIK